MWDFGTKNHRKLEISGFCDSVCVFRNSLIVGHNNQYLSIPFSYDVLQNINDTNSLIIRVIDFRCDEISTLYFNIKGQITDGFEGLGVLVEKTVREKRAKANELTPWMQKVVTSTRSEKQEKTKEKQEKVGRDQRILGSINNSFERDPEKVKSELEICQQHLRTELFAWSKTKPIKNLQTYNRIMGDLEYNENEVEYYCASDFSSYCKEGIQALKRDCHSLLSEVRSHLEAVGKD